MPCAAAELAPCAQTVKKPTLSSLRGWVADGPSAIVRVTVWPTAMVAGAALPLATALALAPTATAQTEPEPPKTETVAVTYTCTPDNALNVGGAGTWTNDVTVTYPESVAPGAFFNVTVQAGQMSANTVRSGRFTYDIQSPTNVTNLTATLAGGQSGFSSGTPALATVNPTTKVTATGTNVHRIWGGTSAAYGTSTGTSNNSGLQKNTSGAFRLPAVTFAMRAPVTPGAQVVFGLPGAGAAAANNGANTQFGYSRGTSAAGTGTGGASISCAVSANAAQLSLTTVADVAPNILNSTTNIVGGDQTADSSIPVTLQAQVAAPYATAGEISQGTVTFRDQATNLIIGTASPNAQGFAIIQHQFPRIPDGDPDQPRTVIAEYSGVTGNISPSQDTIVLTLTDKPTVFWNTNFTVRANVGQLGEESLPVNVTTTFSRPSLNFPEGTLVQLFRDALPLGEPVAMPATGTSITFPTDEIDRAERTGTHRYSVELVTIWFDYNEWKGSTPNPAVVIVAGKDGESVAPVPDTGSLDLGSLTSPVTSSLSDSVGYDVAPLSSPTVTGLLSSAS